MRLQVSATNEGEFASRMAYAVWAYLHRCCQKIGAAKIVGNIELRAGFVGESEVEQVPTVLASAIWRVSGRGEDGQRMTCFVRVKVGEPEPDDSESMEYLSLWPKELLFLKIVGGNEVRWSEPEQALEYLNGSDFPEPV